MAIDSRRNTSVSGGNSFNATPVKKNVAPQSTESTTSRAQSRASICSSAVAIPPRLLEGPESYATGGCNTTCFPTTKPCA